MNDRDYDIEMFLDGIRTLSKMYNISIAHEDGQGAFILEDYDERNLEWLEAATICVKENAT